MNIKKLQLRLLQEGRKINVGEWQSVQIEQPMIQLTNIYERFNCPAYKKQLEFLEPHLPWAEDHFQERIGGYALNPGKQWENWPFYSKNKDDKRFRSNEGVLFDHTYMERFWPPKDNGIRYKMGDLNDIIDRLKKNIHNRQSYLSIWHPEDQSNDKENKRIPCTLGYHFQSRDKYLDMTYFIRSCDAVRHLANDMYMTGRLLQHVAKEVQVETGVVYVWIGNLHCFESDKIYIKNKLLK